MDEILTSHVNVLDGRFLLWVSSVLMSLVPETQNLSVQDSVFRLGKHLCSLIKDRSAYLAQDSQLYLNDKWSYVIEIEAGICSSCIYSLGNRFTCQISDT